MSLRTVWSSLVGGGDVIIQAAVAAKGRCRRTQDDRRPRRSRTPRSPRLALARAPAAAGDHRAGGGPDRGRREPLRLGPGRLVRRALEHDHEDLDRLPARGDRPDHAADDHHRLRLVLGPALRLRPRRGPLDAGLRLLRDRRGAQLRAARQHRHVRDAADVPGDDRGRHLRRRHRRLRRPESLLHRHRRGDLAVPVPVARRHVQAAVRLHRRTPRSPQ